MYATVRRYDGIRNPDELAKRVREGFVPLISEHRGFVAYYWVDDSEEGVMFSTSVFENQADEEDPTAWPRTSSRQIWRICCRTRPRSPPVTS
jgi:hypothetical protein